MPAFSLGHIAIISIMKWKNPNIYLPRCNIFVLAMVRYPWEDRLIPEVVWRTNNQDDRIADSNGFVTCCMDAEVVAWCDIPAYHIKPRTI